ncbi:MAG TPA: hypothetical protein VMU77_04550 [Acidimicrobiales bacterium]|nr:hypothetical protein [Acidimicrobiales bacterium]
MHKREFAPRANHGEYPLTSLTTPALILIFVAGSAVSIATSFVLIKRIERVASRFGLTETALGLIAALAADAPEISSSVSALMNHQRDVAAGVIFGSNIFNIAALLGLGACVAKRVNLHRRVVILEGVLAIWIALTAYGSVRRTINPLVSLIAVAVVSVPYLAVCATGPRVRNRLPLPGSWLKWISEAVVEEEEEIEDALNTRPGTVKDVLVGLAAVVIVVMANVAMERAATTGGTRLGMPNIVIGGIILAAVTSIPNAVAAVYLARKSLGNALLSEATNSNSLNIIAGLLIPAAIIGMGSPSVSANRMSTWYLAMSVVVLAAAYLRKGMGTRSGAVVIGIYALFVALTCAGVMG